jgi:SEC-C motif-containing protein
MTEDTDSTFICPCLSGKQYANCCQPLHRYSQTAASAEQLMRSRYSAFYLAKLRYLIDTLHADKRRADDPIVLQKTIDETQWLGLKILKHRSQPDSATVEFIAFYFADESIGQLHEKSNFIRQDKRWFYIDGDILAPVKLSRNDPCPCGSGKKLKKCHSQLSN